MTPVHLLVRVGPERYALPVERVLEVVGPGDVCPVFGVPPEVLGVRNLRGQVLPVLDLGGVLGIAPARHDGPLVVVEVPPARAMLAVDELVDVGSPGDAAEDTESELLSGAVLVDGGLVGVLDLPRLLDAIHGDRA